MDRKRKKLATKTEEAVPGVPEMLVQEMVWLGVDQLRRYPDNPRVGNKKKLAEAIKQSGYAKVLVVQKSTMYVLDGNHTHQCAGELGYTKLPCVLVDVDDATAAKMVLAFNRLNDLGYYDEERTLKVMQIAGDHIGTGYTEMDFKALNEAVDYYDMDQIAAVLNPVVKVVEDEHSNQMPEVEPVRMRPERKPPDPALLAEIENEDAEDGEIETVETSRVVIPAGELYFGNNEWQIPDLRSDMLVESIPDDFDTWGGEEATPDDGTTTWLWVYGVSSRKNLPMDRCLLSFFSYDKYFNKWWDMPEHYVGGVLELGVHQAVVPDFSTWDADPRAWHIWQYYRAQWIGRYMQENGIRVMPRLMFNAGDKGIYGYCLAGIPKNPPVLAGSAQHGGGAYDKEATKRGVDLTIEALRTIEPEVFLMYGGKPALRGAEILDKKVGKDIEVRHVWNYSAKRRGLVFDRDKMKARDPYFEAEPVDTEPE